MSAREVDEARIRVDINGLLPLEKTMEIPLPTNEVTILESGYLTFEK